MKGINRQSKESLDFKSWYKEFSERKEKSKSSFSVELSKKVQQFISKNSPYKIGDVLEVVDNKRMKLQRLAIYSFNPTLFDGELMVSAIGWWLNKNGEPVKWDGSGYPIINCVTFFKMKLADNQFNISKEDYDKSKLTP